MALRIQTKPAIEPITLAEAKAHLRIDSDADPQSESQSIAPGAHVIAAAFSLQGSAVTVTGYTASVYLDAGTCGASGTVDVRVEESNNGTTWTAVTGGTFTQVTEANDNAVYEYEYTGNYTYIRAAATVAVATCSFGVNVVLRTNTTDENDLIESYIAAARQTAELCLGRTLIDTSYTLTLDAFPPEILLLRAPIQSVTSIAYIDDNGDTQTLDSGQYQVDAASEPGRVIPAYGCSWPSTREQMNAVSVIYLAGYGDERGDVPEWAKIIVYLLLGVYYENREGIAPIALHELPFGIRSLIWNHRARVKV